MTLALMTGIMPRATRAVITRLLSWVKFTSCPPPPIKKNSVYLVDMKNVPHFLKMNQDPLSLTNRKIIAQSGKECTRNVIVIEEQLKGSSKSFCILII